MQSKQYSIFPTKVFLTPILSLLVAASAWAGTEQQLYNFTGGADGRSPIAGLTADAQGNLYGTTFAGGLVSQTSQLGFGAVYKLTPTNGGYIETVLYAFQGEPA